MNHKKAIRLTLVDIHGISPSYCMHKIRLKGHTSTIQYQRRLNLRMKEVVKREIIKWLDTRVIYPIANRKWVSPVHYVLKKGMITVIQNEDNKWIPTLTVMG